MTDVTVSVVCKVVLLRRVEELHASRTQRDVEGVKGVPE